MLETHASVEPVFRRRGSGFAIQSSNASRIASSLESRRLARSAWNFQWRSVGSRMVVFTKSSEGIASGEDYAISQLFIHQSPQAIPPFSQSSLSVIFRRPPAGRTVLKTEQRQSPFAPASCLLISFLFSVQGFCSKFGTPHEGDVPGRARRRSEWRRPPGRPETELSPFRRGFFCRFAALLFLRLPNRAVYGKEVIHGSC